MSNSKSRVEFEAKIERPLAYGSSGLKRAAIIALAALSLIFATAWAGAGSRVDVSAHAVAHSQPQHSRSWAITVRFGDGTIARGYVDPDPPGVGQSVTIRVDLSCGHTHTLHGIQDAEGHMHGEGYDSVTPGHTSSASVKASKNSGPDPVPSWDGGPSS